MTYLAHYQGSCFICGATEAMTLQFDEPRPIEFSPSECVRCGGIFSFVLESLRPGSLKEELEKMIVHGG